MNSIKVKQLAALTALAVLPTMTSAQMAVVGSDWSQDGNKDTAVNILFIGSALAEQPKDSAKENGVAYFNKMAVRERIKALEDKSYIVKGLYKSLKNPKTALAHKAYHDGMATLVLKKGDPEAQKWKMVPVNILYDAERAFERGDVELGNFLFSRAYYLIADYDEVRHHRIMLYPGYRPLRVAPKLLIKYGFLGKKLLSEENEIAAMKHAWGYLEKVEGNVKKIHPWVLKGTENHDIISKEAAYFWSIVFAGHPDYMNKKNKYGLSGKVSYTHWNDFYKLYFSQRGRKGTFLEVGSMSYGHHMITLALEIYDYAPDPELRRLVGDMTTLLLTLYASMQVDDVRAGGKPRYSPKYRAKQAVNESHLYDIYFDPSQASEIMGKRYPWHLSDYTPPDIIQDIYREVNASKKAYNVYHRIPGTLSQKPYFESDDGHHLASNTSMLSVLHMAPEYGMGTIVWDPNVEALPGANQSKWQGLVLRKKPPESFKLNRLNTVFIGAQKEVETELSTRGMRKENKQLESMLFYQTNRTIIARSYLPMMEGPLKKRGLKPVVFFFGKLKKSYTSGDWYIYSYDDVYVGVQVFGESGVFRKDRVIVNNKNTPLVVEAGSKSEDGSLENFEKRLKSYKTKQSGKTVIYQNDIATFDISLEESVLPLVDGKYPKVNTDSVYNFPHLKGKWGDEIFHIKVGDKTHKLDFSLSDKSLETKYRF
tara:strand:+ start:1755 stop:3875 length:2121 start_codon:yes stop_codon:yes gene_type:complete